MEGVYINWLEMDLDSAHQLLMRHLNVTLWSRIAFRCQFCDESRAFYISCSAQNFGQNQRGNYYVVRGYEDGWLQNGTLEVYYGQVI